MTTVPSRASTLVTLLRDRAFAEPHARAFQFLRDGEVEDASLTYAALDTRARAIAAALQRSGVQRGDRVLVAYPPGLEFVAAFFGCVYAGAIAVPVQPPAGSHSPRGIDRLVSIADDADPAAILTTTSLLGRCNTWISTTAARIATDLLNDEAALDGLSPGPHCAIEPTDIAFLQYTSGSTAAPRGVMVTHANLIANLAAAHAMATPGEVAASVSWLPVTHDMGLIEGVLQPIYRGHLAVLMSPAAFLQRPVRWLAAIDRYRAARSGGPNFAYDLCARRVSAAAAATLDLRCWRDAYNGAEPVRAETMAAFASAFRSSGFRPDAFRPSYGLAEATLIVAAGRWRDGAGNETIAYVTPAKYTEVRIVSPHTRRPCSGSQVGELWLTGPGVAAGYWRNVEATREVFQARTIDGAGPYLRTGDLGSFVDGSLRVCGRLKDLLIVRGVKHFPQDLERAAATSHAAVRRGAQAAVAIDADPERGDRVAMVVELDPRAGRSAEHADVIASIRLAVAEACGVQLHGVALVGAGVVPMTPSGKVQRSRARAWWSGPRAGALAVWTAVPA